MLRRWNSRRTGCSRDLVVCALVEGSELGAVGLVARSAGIRILMASFNF
jgi:hypothetical protein